MIALVGNKLDLEGSRTVSTKEAQTYAKEAGLIFAECSAKKGDNVMEVFTELAKNIPLDKIASSGRQDNAHGNDQSANRVNLNGNGNVNVDNCAC